MRRKFVILMVLALLITCLFASPGLLAEAPPNLTTKQKFDQLVEQGFYQPISTARPNHR